MTFLATLAIFGALIGAFIAIIQTKNCNVFVRIAIIIAMGIIGSMAIFVIAILMGMFSLVMTVIFLIMITVFALNVIVAFIIAPVFRRKHDL